MSDTTSDTASNRTKQRIAILGGGPAGLSTAYHLTNREGWQDEYEITIYQLGWRAGGKAASSRNSAHGQRIEEHGIHLFGNFYFNMFGMLRDCYESLYGTDGADSEQAKATGEPVTTIDDAFKGSNFQALPDIVDGRWRMQTGWLAHNDGVPWSGEMPDPDTVVNAMAYQALAVLTGKRPGFVPHEKAGGGMAGFVRRIEDWVIRRVARAVQRHLDRDVKDHSRTLAELAAIRDRMRRFMRRFTTHSPSFRWKFVQIDLLATLLQGIIADEVLSPGFEIDVLDQWDYREWLQKHGVDPISLASGFAQIVPNIGFNYPDGDSTQYPAFSAAPYVYFFIRQMVASGDALYFFAAGTGDTVVAPIYRTLVQRGVKFEFFHKVTEVVPGQDTIDTIKFEVQAHVKPEHAPYDPLIRVKGMYTWPDHPKYGQLVEGPQLATGKVDLESYWADWKGEEKVLTRGAEGDTGFDYVVLAISVAALPTICPAIVDRPDWRQMVDKIQAFPTQQLQIWLDKTVEELGWDYQLDPTSGDRVVGANYTYPYITFCDFTDLIQWEDWPEESTPKSVVYFSGTLQKPTEWPPYSDHDFPAREHLRARATAIQYLRTIRGLLPDANTNPDQPESLDFTLLHQTQHDPAVRGEALFDSQYWRANIDPTERYVGSVKQTVQFRKKAWESGFTNMALAGDWTYNGMNIGSIESAATSGAMASLALSGFPALDDIPGLTFLHGDLKGPERPLIPGPPIAPPSAG